MLFNSFQFAYFFAALLPTYWLLRNHYRWQNVLLLAAGGGYGLLLPKATGPLSDTPMTFLYEYSVEIGRAHV